MDLEKPPKETMLDNYQGLIQAEIDSGNASNPETAVKLVELAIFNERIDQFSEDDLTQDSDGSWNTFEQKVRDIFPEIPDDRFKGMKAAVTMHLCGL